MIVLYTSLTSIFSKFLIFQNYNILNLLMREIFLKCDKIPLVTVWFSNGAQRVRMPIGWNSRCVYAILSALHAHVTILWSHSCKASSSVHIDNARWCNDIVHVDWSSFSQLSCVRVCYRLHLREKFVYQFAIKRWWRIIDNLDSDRRARYHN